jgi:hypothetical protein
MKLPRSPLVPALIMVSLLITAGCTGFSQRGSPAQSSPASATATPAPGPVVGADAYPPAEPYEIDPRFVRNTPEYRVDPALFTQVYHNHFTLGYNSVGLLATVEEAPLVVDFSVTPGNSNPNYCFFILTVRNGDTEEVIGQEGYARTFSTETHKRLVFTRPGKYHFNLYGTMVEVELSMMMKK